MSPVCNARDSKTASAFDARGAARPGHGVLAGVALLLAIAPRADAHHSFAMYDSAKTSVFTGVVLRVSPDSNHLQIFFAPLNDARDAVLRGADGEPVTWAVEMEGAAQAAAYGVTVNTFPRGTVFSIGLHPLRSGLPAGGRGKSGLFRCPDDTAPAPGQHCDSVPGATAHGEGTLPTPSP
jgi:hypothetical protein